MEQHNTPQPLSEEQLREIRIRAVTANPLTTPYYLSIQDVLALLAEVERLKASKAAMRTGIDEMIAFIQEARAAARPQHFSETADNILIRAINAGRAAQEESEGSTDA